jgi:hypothetical protein
MTTTIPAIEATYHGCRFRSRKEARWAVFMDHLGIPWEYEPQGYVVDGVPYLPDFLVYPGTDQAMWLEIKGEFPTNEELAKAAGLAEGTGIRTYLYFGPVEPPAPGLSDKIITWEDYFAPVCEVPHWHSRHGWIHGESEAHRWEVGLLPTAFRFDAGDFPGPVRQRRQPKSGFWWWTDCPHCGKVVLKLEGQVGWCPSVADPPEGESLYPRFAHETPRLLEAYRAARSARFEHGETPDAP